MKNKVMKETINVLKAMKGINEMNTTEVQFYITDADGLQGITHAYLGESPHGIRSAQSDSGGAPTK